ncbi:quinon protein alcohol dehydrogenase-like superfamily [Hygrophoropsis aurantiaca]|uniref:Quinon protein alcohol dehydrogenase-like superfamily n=1 Tax=Hygrophoropsis aurantiaca TaxID=72124 RepID=A0ACB7ZVM2_9AGAM|nr:quinon protein alcohol dehydrogenase-like superfamily [Hygrophoropsis aurantiaca]
MATSASPSLEDPASHLSTKVFKGHTDFVWSVAYFHDGKHIISGSEDKTIRIWDVESRTHMGESLAHDYKVYSVAVSPDGRRLVSGGKGVALWDLGSRAVRWKKENSEVRGYRVAYSPGGQLIAAGHDEVIVLLNAETGEQIRDSLQFGERAWCLAFSPDAAQLAAGSRTGEVRVFDVATGETVVGPFKGHTDGVTSLVYTLDGQQFITASWDFSIRVWDAATGQEIGDLMRHEDWIRQIALSRDGQRLASASDDRTVRVWDLKTRRQIGGPLQAQDSRDFFSVAWSPDGRSIIAATKENIYLWDSPPLDDHTAIPQASVPTTSIAPLPITSRPRQHSVSSSILNLPAGSQPLNQTPATNKLPDDFFDSSPNLPGHAHNQISVPLRPSIPNITKPKTDPKTLFTSAPSPKTIEMQPPPPKIPIYSPVGKVALGQADKRLYMDESKDKKPKPGDDDSEQEVLVDVEVNCWDIFCAIITSCFPCCSSESQSDK